MTIEENYKILQEICKVKGCYCPPLNEVLHKESNTDLHMRIWFKIKG